MGCSESGTKDFMSKIRDEKPKSGIEESNELRPVRLLRRDLPAKAQSKSPSSPAKRRNLPEQDRPPKLLVPILSGINAGTRPPSLLEQSILPGLRKGAEGSGSSTSLQLTMFYGGTVHVYDNIPFDKAQAIMLLAGESSPSKPGFVPRFQETDHTNLPSVCKLETDMPLARKNSLRHFLKKRHDRITSKAPYAAKSSRPEENEHQPLDYEAQSTDQESPLSPFPSRLGFFSHIATNKGPR